MVRKLLTKWIIGNDSFLGYMIKSAIGLMFSIFVMQVVMPTFLTLSLLPIGTIMSRGVYLSLVVGSLCIIVEGYVAFQFYFALPYLLVSKWLERKVK